MAGPSGPTNISPPGHVVLVGAGPGDPDLLTVRAVREIAAADVVFADRLVGKGVMDLIPASAETVYVGKSKGEHSVPQEDIHRRMIAAAQAGKRVVRLKGGDPFIFGRGGEEVEALREAGVRVDVVPGISSALGAAASMQVPLTHRDAAQSVTFVTGHAALGKEPDLDWVSLARPNQTVVVFMGVGTAGMIAARLIAAGRSPSTPVAIVENATRANEIAVFGSLDRAAELIQSAGINGPALLVIGEVVALARDAQVVIQADPGNARRYPGESRDPSPGESERSDMGPGSALRSARDDKSRPTLSDLWRMFS